MADTPQETSPVIFRYRGREVDFRELERIRSILTEYGGRGRSFVARRLCELWEWRQANGAFKECACRDFLLRLEEAGHVRLPPRRNWKNNHKVKDFSTTPPHVQEPLVGSVKEFSGFEVRLTTSVAERYLWDWLVHRHHYLGQGRPLIGEHLKYLAFLEGRVVGCVGWASPAWRCRVREAFIGWTDEEKRRRLPLVVNNVRFLILPYVRVTHLASKILGANTRRLAGDWQRRWGHSVVLAETFVDVSRFAGTCYRAANWLCVGKTEGFARRGHSQLPACADTADWPSGREQTGLPVPSTPACRAAAQAGQTGRAHGCPKALFVYPLHRRFRELLCS